MLERGLNMLVPSFLEEGRLSDQFDTPSDSALSITSSLHLVISI